MPRLEACLVDAYDTIVTCDFGPLRHGVPALAGISVAAWEQEYGLVSLPLNDGRMSKAQAFRQIMASCGTEAPEDLVAEMVRRDQELLLAHAHLFDDAVPFLTRLRDRDIKIAIVSNCTENTRAMLVATGVDKLADELVLSCEVLSAKPSPGIYQHALRVLGVPAEAAVFVDDQARFCAGSVAVGIRAAQIVRGEPDGQRPIEGVTVVRSLSEVEAMFEEQS
ncbi:MAG TPA: HAD family hydrolase [Streptosporangiaceae bacterium]